MYKNQRVTLVIPCLNEEEGVRRIMADMPAFVDEVIVVDNGSTDNTTAVAREFGALVVTEGRRGYGRAYKAGFAQATGDIIVTLDGDHSYPVDALRQVLEAFMRRGVSFVSASRLPKPDPDAMSFKHRIGNRALSLAMSLLFFRWVHDSQSGMWVFRRDALSKMNLISDGMSFSEEIKIEAMTNREIGFQEMFINYSRRVGQTKLRPWRDGLDNLIFLFRKRFGRRPVRSFGPARHEVAPE
ncbi:MAG TPA: glycosyltransferase family 2 protein [Terriglobia bacterium]|nr:glycosyltransferase family 2 protein [Terriglobia bacterium]